MVGSLLIPPLHIVTEEETPEALLKPNEEKGITILRGKR
jgi:hypothetical protein